MSASVGRLPARSDFLRVAAAKNRFGTRGLVLQVAPVVSTEPSTPIRVGFTATKKIGNAVIRNRARRRLRAAARQVMAANASASHDYVLLARPDTADRPYELLLGDLRTALKKLGVWRETEVAH